MSQDSAENRDLPLVLMERPVQSTHLAEHVLFKNRLQEYTQRSAIPLPKYQIVNEGSSHAPKFRATVSVDGKYYTSINTFSHRKTAEQDVARMALDGITQNTKLEGCPFIYSDTVFCKSILNEFAVKLNLEKPTYNTIKAQGLLPVFISSLVFNGVPYTGEAGRSKKEAEQLAARAVVLSLLGNTDSKTAISEIIKSKSKLYAALHKVEETQHTPVAVNPENSLGLGFALDTGKQVEVLVCTNNMPSPSTLKNSTAMLQPVHVYKKPKLEPSSETFTPTVHVQPSSETITSTIVFVPEVGQQNMSGASSSGKKRKNKKRKKKVPADPQLLFPMGPFGWTPQCSVAQ